MQDIYTSKLSNSKVSRINCIVNTLESKLSRRGKTNKLYAIWTFVDETVWLTIQQLVQLYQTSRTNVLEHIYEEQELDRVSTCRNFRQVRKEGNREVSRDIPFYNLDMIISLGYRIKSVIATKFRKWATQRLKELKILNNLVSGYFDFDEIQAIEHIPMYMKGYIKQLNNILASGNRKILENKGKVSHQQAIEKAEIEYKEYQKKQLVSCWKWLFRKPQRSRKKSQKKIKASWEESNNMAKLKSYNSHYCESEFENAFILKKDLWCWV